MPYIVTISCIECGTCVSGCENNAIQEGESHPYIDPDICIECDICASNCPVEAIIFVEEPSDSTGKSTNG